MSPSSIMHELVGFHKNYEAMQFLVDRGIDLTIKDYRWNSTAQGWASYFGDEKMAQWLEEAQKRQEQATMKTSRGLRRLSSFFFALFFH